MIERRPHWDDELISAVTHQVQGFGYVPLDQVVANVIAAVEDWHERKGEDNLPLLMAMQNAEITKFLHRAEQAEAAIKRVREQLHKPWKYECECCTRIWIALEGDSDE